MRVLSTAALGLGLQRVLTFLDISGGPSDFLSTSSINLSCVSRENDSQPDWEALSDSKLARILLENLGDKKMT